LLVLTLEPGEALDGEWQRITCAKNLEPVATRSH